MTFIASVKARNGVALIADSLVTTTKQIIEANDYINLVSRKAKESKGGEAIVLSPQEISTLFKRVPAFTKDYEDKLFEMDKYTAISTAGSAEINGKRISQIISEFKASYAKDKSYIRKGIKSRVNMFGAFVESEAKKHIKKYKTIDNTDFVITHYDRKKCITRIFKMYVLQSSKESLKDSKYKVIEIRDAFEIETVVCDGQNRLTEGLLYGDFLTINMVIKNVLAKVAQDFNIPIDDTYKEKMLENKDLIPWGVREFLLAKLTNLSLQQAVDLANLLMHIELDIQKYTKEIPTVGGVIKLAIIDEDGFRFIAGNEIKVPNSL
ncbi:MAG: hypothetical protein R3B92_02765 [Patescibacteria group bacterium]